MRNGQIYDDEEEANYLIAEFNISTGSKIINRDKIKELYLFTSFGKTKLKYLLIKGVRWLSLNHGIYSILLSTPYFN